MFPKITLKMGAFEITLDSPDSLGDKSHLEHVKTLATSMLLLHRAWEQYATWVDGKPLGEAAAPVPAPEAAPALPPEQRTFQMPLTGHTPFTVVKAVHGMDEKGEYWKVFGGEWTKFGVVAYKDSCRDLVGLFDLPMGKYEGDKVAGWTAVAVMKGDNPLKISEVRKDVQLSQSA